MIGYLRGILTEKTPESLILDVNGVGYEVIVPASSFCVLPPQGEVASLFIHTRMGQDELRLFGFASLFDRKVFELLTSVSNVGPKVALTLLSPLSGEEVCQAITQGRAEMLTRIPGIGAKTAERLLLELREKCQKLLARKGDYAARLGGPRPESSSLFSEPALAPTTAKERAAAEVSNRRQLIDDLQSALLNLGYKEKAVGEALRDYEATLTTPVTLEEALRTILKRLSGRLFQ